MNNALIRNWITALRSGKYRQIRGALYNHHGFCALGVLSEVLGSGRYIGGTRLVEKLTKLDIPVDILDIVVFLNDSERWSFTEIADFLEDQLPCKISHKILEAQNLVDFKVPLPQLVNC